MNSSDQDAEEFQKKERFNHLKRKFGDMPSASSYRSELSHQIANPGEEELTDEDVERYKVILAELNEYLHLGEE